MASEHQTRANPAWGNWQPNGLWSRLFWFESRRRNILFAGSPPARPAARRCSAGGRATLRREARRRPAQVVCMIGSRPGRFSEGYKANRSKSVRYHSRVPWKTYATVSYGYVSVFARPMTSVMRIALLTGPFKPPRNRDDRYHRRYRRAQGSCRAGNGPPSGSAARIRGRAKEQRRAGRDRDLHRRPDARADRRRAGGLDLGPAGLADRRDRDRLLRILRARDRDGIPPLLHARVVQGEPCLQDRARSRGLDGGRGPDP